MRLAPVGVLVALVMIPAPCRGQEDSVAALKVPRGAQFGLPFTSLFFPGFGQYWQKAPAAGLGFSAAAAAGIGLFASDASSPSLGVTDAERALLGAELYSASGYLSAYESFRRAIPALQQRGKYTFLAKDESFASLLSAPFDFRFLGRWTTWVDLGYTAAVTAIAVAVETAPGKRYRRYRVGDALFGTGVSYGAGVGEEALFRGWIYPAIYQATGERFFWANTAQAVFFGRLHLGSAGPFAVMITGWAWYEGWLTRRNGWSIRESIFHHFWYDAVIFAAEFLTEEDFTCAGCARILRRPVVLTFPTIYFRGPRW